MKNRAQKKLHLIDNPNGTFETLGVLGRIVQMYDLSVPQNFEFQTLVRRFISDLQFDAGRLWEHIDRYFYRHSASGNFSKNNFLLFLLFCISGATADLPPETIYDMTDCLSKTLHHTSNTKKLQKIITYILGDESDHLVNIRQFVVNSDNFLSTNSHFSDSKYRVFRWISCNDQAIPIYIPSCPHERFASFLRTREVYGYQLKKFQSMEFLIADHLKRQAKLNPLGLSQEFFLAGALSKAYALDPEGLRSFVFTLFSQALHSKNTSLILLVKFLRPQNPLGLINPSTCHLVFEHLRNLLKSPNSPDPFSKSLSQLFGLDRSHTVLWVFLIQQTRNKHLVDELVQIGNDLVIANLLSPEAYFIQIVERKFVRKNWIQKLIQTIITHANTVNSEEEIQSTVEMLQSLKDRRWLTKEELAFHLKQVECDQKTL